MSLSPASFSAHVDAVQFTSQNGIDLANWLNSAFYYISKGGDAPVYFLDVPTGAGETKKAVIGNWIIKWPDGTYSVQDDDAFTKSFHKDELAMADPDAPVGESSE